MQQPTRTGPEPVHLGIPAPEPEPVPGCDVCAALARQRVQARTGGDDSRVSDCSVEIRRHPHRSTR